MRTEVSNITDITDMHMMGHTCANLNGELFFFWGGINDKVAFVPIANSDLWIYETLTGYWRHRTCTGECPPYLSSSTSSLIGQKMFVFGGHSTVEDNWLNSLFCLNLETFVWTDLGSRAKAEPTKPIPSDKCVSWSFEGKLYVFGGYGWSQTENILQLLDRQKDLQLTPDYRWPKFGWNNQLVEYDPSDGTWRWPSYSGKCPSARAAHSGALMGDMYYVFGGRDSLERLNDLYTFDMKTFEWTHLASFSSAQVEHFPVTHHLLDGPEDSNHNSNQNSRRPSRGSISETEEYHEHLTPSPSSSRPMISTHFSSEYQDEENLNSSEEEGDSDIEYPHQSNLLERWSIGSSHRSASDINNNYDHPRNFQENHMESCNNENLTTEETDQTPEQIVHQYEVEGQVSEEFLNRENDQFINRLESLESTSERQTTTAPMPTGRSFSSFTPISDHEILLYGGVSSQDKNLDDCWLFNVNQIRWRQIDLKQKRPRLWHTGSRTKNNEVVIIGGSNSDKIDKFCTEILTISREPKSLKRIALDTTARSVRMRTVLRVQGLPSTIGKLIRLRKQAIALTMRRTQRIV